MRVSPSTSEPSKPEPTTSVSSPPELKSVTPPVLLPAATGITHGAAAYGPIVISS